MKKIFALLLAIVLMLSLAACSQEENKETTQTVDHSGHNHSHSHADLPPSAGNSEHLLAEYEALADHYVKLKQDGMEGAELVFQQILNTQTELESYAGRVREQMGEEAYQEFLNQVNAIGERIYDNMG